ncbi:hypothetical protein BT69DRAFT_1331853 [Atractiella rhizophila]|nr:hypothetical protein BT69DRAFT_1331853 [Atractiella rhizophila]
MQIPKGYAQESLPKFPESWYSYWTLKQDGAVLGGFVNIWFALALRRGARYSPHSEILGSLSKPIIPAMTLDQSLLDLREHSGRRNNIRDTLRREIFSIALADDSPLRQPTKQSMTLIFTLLSDYLPQPSDRGGRNFARGLLKLALSHFEHFWKGISSTEERERLTASYFEPLFAIDMTVSTHAESTPVVPLGLVKKCFRGVPYETKFFIDPSCFTVGTLPPFATERYDNAVWGHLLLLKRYMVSALDNLRQGKNTTEDITLQTCREILTHLDAYAQWRRSQYRFISDPDFTRLKPPFCVGPNGVEEGLSTSKHFLSQQTGNTFFMVRYVEECNCHLPPSESLKSINDAVQRLCDDDIALCLHWARLILRWMKATKMGIFRAIEQGWWPAMLYLEHIPFSNELLASWLERKGSHADRSFLREVVRINKHASWVAHGLAVRTTQLEKDLDSLDARHNIQMEVGPEEARYPSPELADFPKTIRNFLRPDS